MTNFKSLLYSACALLAASILLSSCVQDEVSIEKDGITEETRAKFEELGFDVSDIQMVPNDNPLSKESGGMNYLLEGDIAITPMQLDEMLDSDIHGHGVCGEQYRTTNLVSSPQTITVIGYTGSGYALDNTMRTALQWAVNNYNRLNMGLTFSLSFAASTNADIVVYRQGSGAGGSAGFPSGGNPYKWVKILSGTSSYGTNVTEHVITHEIGHCLGMRHADYFNRSLSCGSGGNEGSGGVGAIHVPGTPTGFDANSIMLSCFSANEDGEFGSYDITALEYLY